MRNAIRKSATVIAVLCLVLASFSSAEAAGKASDRPHRHLGSLDGKTVQVVNPQSGLLWAAWSYRNGAEFDLAVAVRDLDGFWSEPNLIGLDDGLNQIQPALAADAEGHLYVVYAEKTTGRVLLQILPFGATEWNEPVSLNAAGGRGSAPAIMVLDDHLIIAYQVKGGTELTEKPLYTPLPTVLHGLQDDPDPTTTNDPDDGKDDDQERADDEDQRESVGTMRAHHDVNDD